MCGKIGGKKLVYEITSQHKPVIFCSRGNEAYNIHEPVDQWALFMDNAALSWED